MVSDSGENQLPSPTKEKTPTKSDTAVGVSRKADSKDEPSNVLKDQHKDSLRASTTEQSASRGLQDLEAKISLRETTAEFEDYKSRSSAEISALTVALKKAEDALQYKKSQCDRLSSELAEIERSLSREKQNQSIAEQTESALLRQARDAKDQLTATQSRNESYRENDI